MKLIKTTEAVGHVICHDITRIIPGKEKGAVYKKGHIIKEEDIPVLLSVGKESLYVWENDENMLHEDEAAEILKKISVGDSKDFICTKPSEGKIEIKAGVRGLFKVDSKRLKEVNSFGEMMIATIHGNQRVEKGQRLAGTRIIPLVIEKEKLEKVSALVGVEPLFSIKEFKKMTYSIITTGNEVYKGLIKDAFGPVLKSKMDEYPTEFREQVILPDDKEKITDAICKQLDKGVDIILCSGGMSVDPDDCTPGAIKDAGANIISYGAPVLPGAMFLLAYVEKAGKRSVILGLPGCVMYNRRTVFDLCLPRIMAGETITHESLVSYGEGGLCQNCEVCHFPNCGFGK